MIQPFLPDIIALGLITISVLISLVRGFVKELISVVSWIVAAWLSIRYSKDLAQHITFTEVQSLRVFLAFLIVFVTIIFIGATINFMIGQVVRKTPFSAADRILGMGFGFVRGVLVLSVLVLLGGLTPLPRDAWWQESYAIARVEKISIWMQSFLPAEISQYFNFSHSDTLNETSPPQAPIEVKKQETKKETTKETTIEIKKTKNNNKNNNNKKNN